MNDVLNKLGIVGTFDGQRIEPGDNRDNDTWDRIVDEIGNMSDAEVLVECERRGIVPPQMMDECRRRLESDVLEDEPEPPEYEREMDE